LAFLLFGFDFGFGFGLGSDLAFGFVSTTGSTCKGLRQDLQFP